MLSKLKCQYVRSFWSKGILYGAIMGALEIVWTVFVVMLLIYVIRVV